jgi:hypothetical protein
LSWIFLCEVDLVQNAKTMFEQDLAGLRRPGAGARPEQSIPAA